MKFWDSSAIVPLLVAEPASQRLLALLDVDGGLIAWWGTPVECVSAISRRECDGDLDADSADAALARLRALEPAWTEVIPSPRIRGLAQRLLRVHPLRAADSLQLAAALVAADQDPTALSLACLDDGLAAAARREGFEIVS